jgi:hypothetical protein
VLVASLSLLIGGILAALRQIFHLSSCPSLPGHLYRRQWRIVLKVWAQLMKAFKGAPAVRLARRICDAGDGLGARPAFLMQSVINS